MKSHSKTLQNVHIDWNANMRLANHASTEGRAEYQFAFRDEKTWMAQYLEGRDQPFTWSHYSMS